jgi:hypothetical protein
VIAKLHIARMMFKVNVIAVSKMISDDRRARVVAVGVMLLLIEEMILISAYPPFSREETMTPISVQWWTHRGRDQIKVLRDGSANLRLAASKHEALMLMMLMRRSLLKHQR